MEFTRQLVNRTKGWIEQLFPSWAHQRHRRHWERQWAKPDFTPMFKGARPQKELVEAIDSGWFQKDQRIIDLGCGSGEVSWWLAGQGFSVLGLDYSATVIKSCREMSVGQVNAPIFEVADLCSEDLQLAPVSSLYDRGCFHRTVLHEIFARNIARATVEGGHFLLIASTFQDRRTLCCGSVRSELELREHVSKVFGDYFLIERAEPAVINPAAGQEELPALAFWMVRKPPVPAHC